MSDEERFIQWLLATGGDPEAPGVASPWQPLRQDPAWQELAAEIQHWDRQLRRQLLEGPIPESSLDRLRQRLLATAAAASDERASDPPTERAEMPVPAGPHAKEKTPAQQARGARACGRSWKLSALVAAVAAAVLLWWLWPPASLRLTREAWQMLQRPGFNQPEKWLVRRQPEPGDEVPPVLRISRRLRWRLIRLGGQSGVVHHLINHEAQSVQAWLFVLRGTWDSLPQFPPKQPQWQQTRAVAGCWADPRKGRTYILIVPGTIQQYRFWITAGPLASLLPKTRSSGGFSPARAGERGFRSRPF